MSRLTPLTHWEIRDFDPGEGRADAQGGWLAARAPGDTYQALIAVGRLAHPYQGRGEDAAAWVRDREWWWRTRFVAPAVDEVSELVFEGLDTFAEVFLGGVSLGRTDNMFRRYAFDIGAQLRPGETHRLAIRFDPPALAYRPAELPVWSAFTDRVSRSKRNLIRKAQFGWGWDWGPDLPTVGIWREARLEVRPRAAISDLRFDTVAIGADAEALITFNVEHAEGLTLDLSLTDPDGRVVFQQSQPAGAGTAIVSIVEPRLWWTADLGAQPLYSLTAILRAGDVVFDETRRRVGLRTIAIDESPDPDEPGATFFRFVLNGVPIFAKGACWVPADSFIGKVDEAAYRRLIAQAAGANMNMIRVWGGGIYEPDLFYDLCDELGLLVWQDFMFACAHYPEDAEFAASVKAEVEDQVRRLRHHPSLAVWCGNNEIQAMHRFNADLSGEDIPLSGRTLYEDLMPEILARLDPCTPYRPSSPFGGDHANGMRHGDVHDWTVWHGIAPVHDDQMVGGYDKTPAGMAYTRYAEDQARFVSEFGIQAAPAMATLERWMDAGDLDPESPGFLARIKDEARKANAMMEPVTGQPKTLQQYVDFTQWTQAEGLKFGIEHFRRRRPHCSGALLWQLNDCWPCVSWSLIDYDGVEKAAYHAVRRAFAPMLASFREEGGRVELWITNDTLAEVGGEAVVSLETFDGQIVQHETVSWAAAAGGHATPWTGPAPARDQVLRVNSPTDAFLANRLLSAPIKDLAFAGEAALTVSITRVGAAELRVEIAASAYTPFVHLISDRPDLSLSDSYFDLAAGELRTVRVTASAAIGPNDIDVRAWGSA